jgi:CSLREA domain-containing protein
MCATYIVTKTADTNGTCSLGNCSLREAIAAANASPQDDTIQFAISSNDSGCLAEVCTIKLNDNLGPLVINSNNGALTITNEGGSQRIEISGSNTIGVFQINNGANLKINSLTIRDGSAANGGGISNYGGNVDIYNSTITNNSAVNRGGGIMCLGGAINLINSTITNNSAAEGGGIEVSSNCVAIIINSTISNNLASDNGGGIFNKDGTVNSRNTIIANNKSSKVQDFAGILNSQGYNLIENINGITNTTTNNITEQSAYLAPLGYYGGLTLTRAIFPNSPAIDAGDNCVKKLSCSLMNPPFAIAKDQRGASRRRISRSAGVIDIGAYEYNSLYWATLPNGTQNSNYNFIISQYTTNEGIFSFTMSGLPNGLSLQTQTLNNMVTVQIIGIPTQKGFFQPQLNITSGNQSLVVNYALNVQ